MRKCSIAERRFRRNRLIRGTTLLELCFTVGIASILFAMVLVLTKYVDALTRIRRAQADLGQWHTSLNNWFVQFGEYPFYNARQGEPSRGTLTCQPLGSFTLNLSNTVENACIHISDPSSQCQPGCGDLSHYVFFRSYIVGTPNHIDPWGNAYIYIAMDDNPFDDVSNPRNVYTLFSCGPDGKTKTEFHGVDVNVNNGDAKTERDDVYFEQ